jgi:DNA-binding NarL/FixJ family response regulator
MTTWIETRVAPDTALQRPAASGPPFADAAAAEARELLGRMSALVDRLHELVAELEQLRNANRVELRADAAVPGCPLTVRQRQILAMLAAGATSEGIARELFLSVATVRNHIARALRAVGAHSRLAAVSRARDEGWI